MNETGDRVALIECCNRCLALVHEYLEALRYVDEASLRLHGLALLRAGKLDEALPKFKQVLDSDSSDDEKLLVTALVAQVYEQAGRSDEAAPLQVNARECADQLPPERWQQRLQIEIVLRPRAVSTRAVPR